jgi:hypothetical protein
VQFGQAAYKLGLPATAARTNKKRYRHADQTCRTPAALREHRKDYLLPSRLSKRENPGAAKENTGVLETFPRLL